MSFSINSPFISEHGWGDWSPWSTCQVTCGEGTVGRKRVCLGCQSPELKEAISSGKLKFELSCERTDGEKVRCEKSNSEKQTRICNNGPCGSVGWRLNKKTGRFVKPIATSPYFEYHNLTATCKGDCHGTAKSRPRTLGKL